jgi:aryl-alcohol dehydrogenase-like predicted oxidoreductase
MAFPPSVNRREILHLGMLATAGALLPKQAFSAEKELPLLTKAIPSSGEALPVVGVGTNSYGVSAPDDLAARREVLRRMPQLGGRVVDTAPAYGLSEAVIGDLVSQLGNRQQLFLATKVTVRNGDLAAGKAMLEESFKRLRTDKIDLIQVHSLQGTDEIIPVLLEMKAAKRIRYVGVTTSNDAQHADLMQAMRRYRLDFIQVNYSVGDRESAAEVLPLAQERGMAVLLNIPFGGRRGASLFTRAGGRPLPPWASEFGATSWAQFFLKYVVSHPAVTCAIPGMTKTSHLEDNLAAARGTLPDAATRRKMEQYWDELS